MDQIKIGAFLRQLRQERGLTQGELAERFGVTNRSVSRWETGANLPDLSLLVELADFYGVELRELLDGQRRERPEAEASPSAPEEDGTARRAAEYASRDRAVLARFVVIYNVLALALFTFHLAVYFQGVPNGAVKHVSDFCLGAAYGVMALTVFFLTGKLEGAASLKRRLLRNEKGRRSLLAIVFYLSALVFFLISLTDPGGSAGATARCLGGVFLCAGSVAMYRTKNR